MSRLETIQTNPKLEQFSVNLLVNIGSYFQQRILAFVWMDDPCSISIF